jgi:hypothetical protein
VNLEKIYLKKNRALIICIIIFILAAVMSMVNFYIGAVIRQRIVEIEYGEGEDSRWTLFGIQETIMNGIVAYNSLVLLWAVLLYLILKKKTYSELSFAGKIQFQTILILAVPPFTYFIYITINFIFLIIRLNTASLE